METQTATVYKHLPLSNVTCISPAHLAQSTAVQSKQISETRKEMLQISNKQNQIICQHLSSKADNSAYLIAVVASSVTEPVSFSCTEGQLCFLLIHH